MFLVEIVSLVAVIQFFAFAMMVGKARSKFQIPAPAMSGDPVFERYIRVHQNTLEVLVMFFPSLWIAAKYWNSPLVAGIGFVYLIGRMVYANGYINNPSKRTLGFGLTVVPIFALIILAFVGMAMAAR